MKKLKNYKTYHAGVFIGQSYFLNDGVQSYLIFQLLYYTFRLSTGKTLPEKSNGLFSEKTVTPTTFYKGLSLKTRWELFKYLKEAS